MGDIVTVDQAAAYMRLSASAQSNDNGLLQQCVSAATEMIEDIIGIVAPQQFTEFYNGGGGVIVLRHGPVQSIDAVTEYIGMSAYTLTSQPLGSQTNAWGYTLNQLTGNLERRSFGGGAAMFAPGESNIMVTYTAGLATIPPNVTLAALALVRHLYESTLPKGGRGRGMGAGEDDGTPVGFGFAVPNFVTELLQPNWIGPGVA